MFILLIVDMYFERKVQGHKACWWQSGDQSQSLLPPDTVLILPEKAVCHEAHDLLASFMKMAPSVVQVGSALSLPW